MSNNSITLISQICILCGAEDAGSNGKVLHWLPGQLPLDNYCRRCGSRSLVPEVKHFHMRTVEPKVIFEKPKIGRPSNADLAARLQREGVYARE